MEVIESSLDRGAKTIDTTFQGEVPDLHAGLERKLREPVLLPLVD